MIDFALMRRTWSLGFVLVTLIPGCGGGGGSNQQSARDFAQAYVNARNQGDAAKVCELYSEQLIQSLKTSNCVAFVQEQTSGTATDLTVLRVVQHGDQATATIQARGARSRAVSMVSTDEHSVMPYPCTTGQPSFLETSRARSSFKVRSSTSRCSPST